MQTFTDFYLIIRCTKIHAREWKWKKWTGLVQWMYTYSSFVDGSAQPPVSTSTIFDNGFQGEFMFFLLQVDI